MLRQPLNLNTPGIQALWQIPEAGWLDGGCFCLAEALRCWSADTVAPIGVFMPGEDIMHHAAIAIRAQDGQRVWIVDGMGVSSCPAFMNHWSRFELKAKADFRPVNTERLQGAAYSDEVFAIDDLAEHLRASLGHADDWGFHRPSIGEIELELGHCGLTGRQRQAVTTEMEPG